MGWNLHALLACLTLWIAGCATTTPGSFTPAGFKHASHDLQVTALEDGQLMTASWNLDNYYEKTDAYDHTTLQLKTGPEYTVVYFLDLDGNGEAEKELKDSAYALRFTHRENNGLIWTRTIPLSSQTYQKSLKTLIENYVESISGAGFDVVWVARDTAIVSTEKTFASTLVNGAAGTLAGQETYEAIVDVANLDQLRLDPNHRYRRLHLLLARTPFTREIGNPGQTEFTSLPVLFLAAHANTQEDFDSTEPDFRSLLGRVALGGQSGYVTNLPATASVVPTPAPTEQDEAPESASTDPPEDESMPTPDGTGDEAPPAKDPNATPQPEAPTTPPPAGAEAKPSTE